jgi:hypothetical protein
MKFNLGTNECLIKRLTQFLSYNISLLIVVKVVLNIKEPVLVTRPSSLKIHQNLDLSKALIDKVFLLLNHLGNHCLLSSIVLKYTVMDVGEGAFGKLTLNQVLVPDDVPIGFLYKDTNIDSSGFKAFFFLLVNLKGILGVVEALQFHLVFPMGEIVGEN